MAGLLTLILFSLNALAATEFKIIDLQHHFAEDILPIIQPLVGNDGTVIGMQNHLIIRASQEKIIEIEKIISTFDVERQNLKITISYQNNLQTNNNNVFVSGRKRLGNVTIGANKYPRDSAEDIQLDIENNQSSTRNDSNQFINVLDGERAFILIGHSVPYTQEWVTLTRRYASIKQTTEFVNINTGFSIKPHNINDQIELEVTPRISQLNQNKYIDFEELSTIIRVNRGEWLDLSGAMQQKDEVSRTILSSRSGNQSQSSTLSIRVE